MLASCVLGTGAHAQVPVQANANHEQFLASADSRLGANKRLVYDFNREVFEGGHMEFVEKQMTRSRKTLMIPVPYCWLLFGERVPSASAFAGRSAASA
jgi:hypothetical protein